MKRKVLTIISLCLLALQMQAAFVRQAPVVRLQPNGDTLRCYVTGDEYYQRLHDELNYTIVQNRDGWYVYAQRQWNDSHSDWTLVGTTLVAGRDNPVLGGLEAGVAVSPATLTAMHHKFDIPAKYRPAGTDEHGNSIRGYETGAKSASDRNHGTLNNIVIFIRFADDGEISTPYSTIEGMFNDSSANAVSMHNYFWHASYGQLRIPTHFYPTPQGNSVISYQDSMPRSYYMPYSSANPNGYQSDGDRADREFTLLENAVNWVNVHSPVPSTLNIDCDNDGQIDNICFIVKGTYTGWSDLLWPHKWALYDRYVYLNGKRVYTFNLQLEGSGVHYFSTSTFCHEMFHTLGAPDLYHYENYTGENSVGMWDLMCSNSTPPQHMGMYMKMYYGTWLDSVPVIEEAGTYTLQSVGNPSGQRNCYRIQGQVPWVWYYLEYRHNTDPFETALPGSGLLVYRIDMRFQGNANFDGISTFDEVYLFHPGGTIDTATGTIAQAFMSSAAGRPNFTATTNPHPFLAGGTIDTTLSITNITMLGDSLTFHYTPHRAQPPVCDDMCQLTVKMNSPYNSHWLGGYIELKNLADEHIAYISKGDCQSSEKITIPVCNEPIRAEVHLPNYDQAMNYQFYRGDGSFWYFTGNNAVLTNPCGASATQHYTLTVASNDEQCFVSGGGSYEAGSVVRIHAYPNDHYIFMGWHDGPYDGGSDVTIVNTDKHRDVTLMSDTLCTAIFVKERVNIYALSADESMGTVSGGGEYPYGDTVRLEASAKAGYRFVRWQMNGTIYEDNPLYVCATEPSTYTAYFESTQGIGEVGEAIRMAVNEGTLHIEGATGKALRVVDMMGRTLWSTSSAAPVERVMLPAHGVYIVCTDSGRKKVVWQ